MDKLHVSITIFLSKKKHVLFFKGKSMSQRKKKYLLKKLDLKNVLFDIKNLIKKRVLK